MIESIMYLGIGFSGCGLARSVIHSAGAYRAVRLTIKRLEASMPLLIAEVRADKDEVFADTGVDPTPRMTIEKLQVETTAQLPNSAKRRRH